MFTIHTDDSSPQCERVPGDGYSTLDELYAVCCRDELVLDHPWFAVTDAQGDFSIEELPSGQYEFTVWHERVGFLERKYPLSVVAGGTTDVTKVYAADLFLKPAVEP